VADVRTLRPEQSLSEYQRVVNSPLLGDTEPPAVDFPATFYVTLGEETAAADLLRMQDQIEAIESVREVNVAIDWPPADNNGERMKALAETVPDDLRADFDLIADMASTGEDAIVAQQAAWVPADSMEPIDRAPGAYEKRAAVRYQKARDLARTAAEDDAPLAPLIDDLDLWSRYWSDENRSLTDELRAAGVSITEFCPPPLGALPPPTRFVNGY
jgi:hypothetical protein